MAFISFAGEEKKARSTAWKLLVGIVLLYIGWQFLLLDIATTGRWYDAIGLQRVLPENQFRLYGASSEGTLVGILLSGMQIYMGIRLASMKMWAEEWMIWMVSRIAIGMFDTYTDMSVRSSNFATPQLIMWSFFVGIIIYNLASEWALTRGVGLVSDNWAAVFPFGKELWGSMQRALKSMQGGGEQKPPAPQGGGNGHHPQQQQRPPVPQGQQHPSFHPGQNRPQFRK